MFEKLKAIFGIKSIGQSAGRIEHGRGARSFNMAKDNRLVSDWLTFARSFNYDISVGGPKMLARGRELFQNDPYTKKIVRTFKKNIVGPNGIILRNGAGEFQKVKGEFKFVKDKLANLMINEAWWNWDRLKYCSIEGDETFRHYCGSLLQSVYVDGEVFVRKLFGKYNPHGFTTQVISSEQVDWRLNKKLANGNFIVMGIEVDPAWKKVAYWITKNNPHVETTYTFSLSRDYVRVPADEILHLYIKEMPHQLRGVTLLAPVGIRLKMFYGFEEAALVKTRGAAKIPWVVYKEKEQLGAAQLQTAKVNDDGNLIVPLEDGEIFKIQEGWNMKNLDSDYPHPMHGPFSNVILHGISAGTDIGYSTISGDYSSVTWHSGKLEKMDERDGFKDAQSWLIENYLNPIFTAWMESAILSGALKLPITKINKFNKPNFIGRRWDYTNPKDDMEANILGLQSFQKTFEQILAERGLDLEEQLDQITEEKELFEKKGLGDLYNMIMTKYNVPPSQPIEKTDGSASSSASKNGNGKAKHEFYYQ